MLYTGGLLLKLEAKRLYIWSTLYYSRMTISAISALVIDDDTVLVLYTL